MEEAYGWKEKLLSRGGKEVLIKAVLQAIPTYEMFIFKLPSMLCREIHSIIKKFLVGVIWRKLEFILDCWGQSVYSKKSRWDEFQISNSFQPSIVSKQTWRLLKFPNTLVAKSTMS